MWLDNYFLLHFHSSSPLICFIRNTSKVAAETGQDLVFFLWQCNDRKRFQGSLIKVESKTKTKVKYNQDKLPSASQNWIYIQYIGIFGRRKIITEWLKLANIMSDSKTVNEERQNKKKIECLKRMLTVPLSYDSGCTWRYMDTFRTMPYLQNANNLTREKIYDLQIRGKYFQINRFSTSSFLHSTYESKYNVVWQHLSHHPSNLIFISQLSSNDTTITGGGNECLWDVMAHPTQFWGDRKQPDSQG